MSLRGQSVLRLEQGAKQLSMVARPWIPELSMQRQVELWEFEATVVYIVSLGYLGLHSEVILKHKETKQQQNSSY